MFCDENQYFVLSDIGLPNNFFFGSIVEDFLSFGETKTFPCSVQENAAH